MVHYWQFRAKENKKKSVHFAEAKSDAISEILPREGNIIVYDSSTPFDLAAELQQLHFASAKNVENAENVENAKKSEVHFASAKSTANGEKLIEIARHLLKTGYDKPEIHQLIRSFDDAESMVHFASAKSTANLQFWFTYHIENSPAVCENCKSPLYYPSGSYGKDVAYSCQAHILPKKLFPSVKSHILNHLTLGGIHQECKCHKQFDSSWLNASRMPVIELAVQKFQLFRHEISQSELKLLPNLFKINT